MVRPAAFMVFALLLAGCGGSAAPEAASSTTNAPAATTPLTIAPTTTTTAPATTTPPQTTTATAQTDKEEEEAEIIAAYLAGWDVFFQMALDPTADPSFIAEARTGRALESTLGFRDELISDGFVGRFPENSVARHQTSFVGFAEDGTAVVTDCFIDDSFAVNESTGEVTDAGIDSGLWAGTMVRTKDGWKLEHTDLQRLWELQEVPECDA